MPNRSSPPTSGSPASAAAQTPAAPMDDITNNEGKEDKPAEKYKYEVPEPMESCLRSMETTHRTILMLRCKVVVVGRHSRKISAYLHVPQRRRLTSSTS